MNKMVIFTIVFCISVLGGCAHPTIPTKTDAEVIAIGKATQPMALNLQDATAMVAGWKTIYSNEASYRKTGQTVLGEAIFYSSIISAVGLAKAYIGQAKTGAVAAAFAGIFQNHYQQPGDSHDRKDP